MFKKLIAIFLALFIPLTAQPITFVDGQTLTAGQLNGAFAGKVTNGNVSHPITMTAGGTSTLTVPTVGTLATLAGAEALTNKSINGITGLLLGNGVSAVSAYLGSACVNQFVRSISASGVVTCASVSGSDLTGGTTGTGAFVLANTPTLITPNIGIATGTSLTLASGGVNMDNAQNITMKDSAGTVRNVLQMNNTNIVKLFSNGSGGTISLQIGNSEVVGVNSLGSSVTGTFSANGHVTFEGVTSTGATGTGNLVFSTSPTFVTPALGTPASGVATNLTGTASGLTAGTVTTNANLTGPITSVGNATSVAAQTGTGSTFVMNTSPTLVTPVLGVASATSVNKVAITAPATSATLTLANSSTLATSGANSITLTSTGSTNITLPTSGTLVNSAVTTLSSLTSIGTIGTGTWQGTTIGLSYGGTNADLSATGGTSQVLKQSSSGAAITVGQLAASDLSNGTTGTGAVALASSPSFTTPTINTVASVGGTWTAAATWTLPALTFGGTISGGGQGINNLGNVGINTNSPNPASYTKALTLETNNGSGAIGVSTTAADGNGNAVGDFLWYATANTGSADVRIAYIRGTTDGATATKRGGKLDFVTRQDNGSLNINMTLDNTGSIYMPNLTQTSVAQTGTVCWSSTGGKLTVDTTVACLASARRFKQNIKPLPEGQLNNVMAMQPVSYQLKTQFNPTGLGEQVGLIADDLEKIDNRLVAYDEEGKVRGVRYMQLTSVLVAAIKEQQGLITELRKQLEELKSLIITK